MATKAKEKEEECFRSSIQWLSNVFHEIFQKRISPQIVQTMEFEQHYLNLYHSHYSTTTTISMGSFLSRLIQVFDLEKEEYKQIESEEEKKEWIRDQIIYVLQQQYDEEKEKHPCQQQRHPHHKDHQRHTWIVYSIIILFCGFLYFFLL
jgi:type VI protein secretion system component VasF